jgi:WD40 repeat protein
MRNHRRWGWLAAVLMLLALPVWAQSDTLPLEPMLRINAPSHIARVNSIATDAAERFAVTVSHDKTVRIWSLPDGGLQRVIRLPTGEGSLGKAYAVAVSPDGGTIAVGGWTSPSGLDTNIYLFGRASGALLQRLPDLPNVVLHLAFSPDGKRLAAALGGASGIRVFDASNLYRAMPSDGDYGTDSYWLAFDHADRLVSASFDGFVRIYSADQYDRPAVPRAKVPGIKRPFSVGFSPDGRHIAVGDADGPNVAVLQDRDLTAETFPVVTGLDASHLSVGWSQDGQQLFAEGHQLGHSDRLARRWDKAGAGSFIDIVGARDSVVQFVSLRYRRMLFADAAGFGLIDAAGNDTRLQIQGSVNLGGAASSLLISADGRTVQVSDSASGHVLRFALARRAIAVDPAEDDALHRGITGSNSIKVTDWDSTFAPKLNGASLVLDKNERSRSIALVPKSDRFALGTEWSLRLFDAGGKEVWPTPRPVPSVVWGVNVSADGRLIVAAYGDGTIRWHRVSDGAELLALFMHPDGRRWVAWTPQGYYDASVGADELIGWQVNHGYDQAPDFFPAAQFQQRFNRRDVIAHVLDTLDVDKAVEDANKTSGQPTARAAPLTTSALTPVVEIKDPAAISEQNQRELAITYAARMTTRDPILRVEAKIDAAAVEATDKELVTQGDTRVGQLRLKLPLHDVNVSVVAFNAQGPSQPATIRVRWRGPGQDKKATLYVLAIGVTKYGFSGLPKLSFPAKDAHDFVALVKSQAGGLYDQVVLYPGHDSLEDANATKEEIIKGLDWIQHAVANSNDVAMIFLAGHGITSADLHYRFLPYDYDPMHLQMTTIKDSDLLEYITSIGGKTIFFFDTCYSGSVLPARGPSTSPDVDRFANELRSAPNGVVVFTSSTGGEFSLEDARWHNGAFTRALVDGLRGAAARSDNTVISIADLESYISRTVRELTGGIQHPMTAKPKTIEDYWIASVVR